MNELEISTNKNIKRAKKWKLQNWNIISKIKNSMDRLNSRMKKILKIGQKKLFTLKNRKILNNSCLLDTINSLYIYLESQEKKEQKNIWEITARKIPKFG